MVEVEQYLEKWVTRPIRDLRDLYEFSEGFLLGLEKRLEGTFWEIYDVEIVENLFVIDIIIRNRPDGDWRRMCTIDLREGVGHWYNVIYIQNLKTDGFDRLQYFDKNYDFLDGDKKHYGWIYYGQIPYMGSLKLRKWAK